MNLLRSVSSFITRAFLGFDSLLNRRFKLRRDGGRIRLTSSPPAGASRPPSRGVHTHSAPDGDIAAAMESELRQLINQHTKTRQLMRHLGYIERSIRLGGPKMLNDIPLDVLCKGHAQLKSIVHDWSSPGLSELRSRLAVTIAAKEEEASHPRSTPARTSDFFTASRMHVSEATASQFQAAEQTWAK